MIRKRNIVKWLSNFRLLGRFSTTSKSIAIGAASKVNDLTKLICTTTDLMSGGSTESRNGTTKIGVGK